MNETLPLPIIPQIHVDELGWFLDYQDPQIMDMDYLLAIINQLPQSEVRGYLVGVHHTRLMREEILPCAHCASMKKSVCVRPRPGRANTH